MGTCYVYSIDVFDLGRYRVCMSTCKHAHTILGMTLASCPKRSNSTENSCCKSTIWAPLWMIK